MRTPRLVRSLVPASCSRRQRAAFERFHTATIIQPVRWGLVLAVALWAMAWCLGAVLRPASALEFGSVLAVLLAGYAALAVVVTRPRVARHLQFLLACCNIASGALVMFGAHYVSDDPEVALIGMIMVTFYAVVAFRIRPHYVLPAMLVYDTAYLAGLHARPGVDPDLFCLHLYLLGIAMVGGFIASVVLEANMRTLFRQRQAIERQQAELKAEHARSEELLHNMLPPSIAARLKQEHGVIAERYEEASILFADLVGFTAFSDGRRPEEVVELLNTLFSRFDELIAARGLEKIKTIGDAYMVVAGLPERRRDHAEALASLALAMHAAADAITVAGGYRPELRIGIHSGPVVAGVIGTRRLAFDVWGDAVNTASRMETLAPPGTILLSEATAALLEHRFEVQERGLVSVKGKGPMNTYALWGERPAAPERPLRHALPHRTRHPHDRPGARKERAVKRPDLLRASALVACMSALVGSSAQWTRELQLPDTDVPSVMADAQGVLAGTDSQVHRSTDGLVFTASAPLPGSPAYIDALFRAGDTLYAGTGGNGLFRSVDQGLSWQDDSQGLSGLGSHHLSDLAVFDGVLYASTMGAGVFRRAPSAWEAFGGLGTNVTANVCFLQVLDGKLWAGAGANGYLWRLDVGATTFAPVLVGPLNVDPFVITDLVRVGDDLLLGSTYGMYRSTDDGATWTWESDAPVSGGPIRFLRTAGALFALVDQISGLLYRSTDEGLTWTLVDTMPTTYAIAAHGARLYAARIDGLWYRDDLVLALPASEDAEHIRVYPNPATDHVVLEGSRSEPLRYRMMDAQGRIVREGRSVNARTVIPLTGLVPGRYVVRTEGAQRSFVHSVVLQ